jgi:hypothetical protein
MALFVLFVRPELSFSRTWGRLEPDLSLCTSICSPSITARGRNRTTGPHRVDRAGAGVLHMANSYPENDSGQS